MIIRPAHTDDFPVLYEIGKATAEFRVSDKDVFMDADEFRYGITDPNSVFLVAEETERLVGFVFASLLDHDKPLEKQRACLIYLTVPPEYRREGIAQHLYDACEGALKEKGCAGMYGWANNESDGSIVSFMERNGYGKGHQYVWMDKDF